jgi:hypothetical protein
MSSSPSKSTNDSAGIIWPAQLPRSRNLIVISLERNDAPAFSFKGRAQFVEMPTRHRLPPNAAVQRPRAAG